MRPVISGVQGALLRAIRRFLEDERQQSFPAMVMEATASEGWASATFSGHRHRLELSFTGGDAARVDALVRELATAELVMPGHIVADISLIEHEMRDGCPHPTHRLVFEALTVAD